MNDLLDYYHQQSSTFSSTLPWLKTIQDEAIETFHQLGFPTRAHENWKYTSIDPILQERFQLRHIKSLPHTIQQNEAPIGHKIMLQNGVISDLHALTSHLPQGVIILPLKDAMTTHRDKVKPYLGEILKTEHGFQALNTAMLHDGLFIYVPEGVVVQSPVLLSHWQSIANQSLYLRHLIVMEKSSALTVIEDYDGLERTSYLTNVVTEVHLHAQAQLTHYKIQRESQLAYHIGQIAVKQARESLFDSHSLSIGGKLVRSDIAIDLCEPKARCFMNGIYAPANEQHVDHHTIVNHLVPDCESTQDYKGILMGHSKAVFNGRVLVEKNAQHTVAKQQNKNLLLSSHAEIDTKPELSIFADDVVCTHGATVGQLDEEALFYLAARGIDRAKASEYLIRAFTIDNFRALKNEVLSDWMSALLNQHLRGIHASE